MEKGLNKEKNQSATSQDDTDSNKALGKLYGTVRLQKTNMKNVEGRCQIKLFL